MRNKKFFPILFGLTTIFMFSCKVESKKKQPPNLIFVFPDQMRAQTLGFLGEEPVLTPYLDEFASESKVLTEAISNCPISSPYRAMLLTGKYPISNGVVTNCTSRSAEFGIELKITERCWSDVLKDNGYSLGYIGKLHLDSPHEPYIDCANNKGEVKWNEWCPPERRHGFDFWYSYGTYDEHLRPLYWTTNAKRDSFHYVDQWGPEHEADMAIKYIENEDGSYRDNNKPFALVVSMNPPHMPYDQVPDKYVKLYDNMSESIDTLCNQPSVPDTTNQWGRYFRKHIKNQLAMVTGVDEQFGRILKAIKENGIGENTIVVFTSDHGDCLGKHEKVSKSNPYEESVNVPFIIRWPGEIGPGIDNLLISSPDIYPTLLDLMGMKNEIPEEVEGTSYAAVLRGEKVEKPTSQLYFGSGGSFDNMKIGHRGVRTHCYTLSIEKSISDTLIYLWDRKSDPYQLNNIAPNNPKLVEQLINEELNPWLEKTKDPWLEK